MCIRSVVTALCLVFVALACVGCGGSPKVMSQTPREHRGYAGVLLGEPPLPPGQRRSREFEEETARARRVAAAVLGAALREGDWESAGADTARATLRVSSYSKSTRSGLPTDVLLGSWAGRHASVGVEFEVWSHDSKHLGSAFAHVSPGDDSPEGLARALDRVAKAAAKELVRVFVQGGKPTEYYPEQVVPMWNFEESYRAEERARQRAIDEALEPRE